MSWQFSDSMPLRGLLQLTIHANCSNSPQAISQLESLLRSNPPISLQPGVFSNLTAAYDLESSSSLGKKLSLLPTLAEYVGEGFYLPALGVR